MSAREHILGTVRRALHVTAAAGRRANLAERLAHPKPNLIPVRGAGDAVARLVTFEAEATRVQADVARVRRLGDAPGRIAAYLAENNLSHHVTTQPTVLLTSLPWDQAPALAVDHDAPADNVAVGVSEAYAGVAETGSLVLLSGADRPVKVNFLPDTHIVVLSAGHIERAYEDVWARLRADHPSGAFMPRTVNVITGPSRTADIEQTLLLGAHGPRRLLIIIVEDHDLKNAHQ